MSPVRRSSGPVPLAEKPNEEPRSRREMIFGACERAPDEQDVGCVDLQKLLLGVLAPPCGVPTRWFHDLEQRPLHARPTRRG
jgi:hypothetical protein